MHKTKTFKLSMQLSHLSGYFFGSRTLSFYCHTSSNLKVVIYTIKACEIFKLNQPKKNLHSTRAIPLPNQPLVSSQ